MRSIDELFDALSRSSFRSRQRLNSKDAEYLLAREPEEISAHARDFISKRLAPARPENDGRQTPMRGHPAFVAQHATATCCRGCLKKWHGVPEDRDLTEEEIAYVVRVIEHWLSLQCKRLSETTSPVEKKGDARPRRRFLFPELESDAENE